MKQTALTLNKLLALLLAVGMVLGMAGCTERGESSEGSESSPSSDVQEEIVLPVTEFLGEKIDQGIERNSDTVGWLYIPNTTIDDAVLQYTDNEYYLRLTEDKQYDVFGCYFADYDSHMGSRSELSRNTIIYGHSDYQDNKDGKKFSQLFHYMDIDFLRNNPYIFFSTPEEDMTWKIFAVFYTHVNFNYIQANPSDQNFAEIISEAKQRSQYIIDQEITKDDKILTLSTCTGLYNAADRDNYRMVVMARLVGPNEATPETMEVEVNPSPKKS